MENLNELAIKILEDAALRIKQNIQKKGITASGRTEKSIKVVERGGKIQLIKEDGRNAPIETLEIGRPGGAVPKGFNQIILEWIKDKGVQVDLIPYKTNRPHKYTVQERSERLAAGAIAYTIRESGTGRHRTPRNDVYSNVVEETILKLRKEIKDAVISSIKTNIQK